MQWLENNKITEHVNAVRKRKSMEINPNCLAKLQIISPTRSRNADSLKGLTEAELTETPMTCTAVCLSPRCNRWTVPRRDTGDGEERSVHPATYLLA